MNKIKLVGVAGADNSGKTTFAEIMLVSKNYRSVEISPLVMKIATPLGWNGTKDDSPRGRPLLVRVGKMVKNEFGEDFLVKRVVEDAILEGFSKIVVPSIRTVGEAEWIRNNGGVMVKVIRQDVEHLTDTEYIHELRKMPADCIIDNNSTLEDFIDKCKGLIAELTNDNGDKK